MAKPLTDRDTGDENVAPGCSCCGSDGLTCNYSPFGCTPKGTYQRCDHCEGSGRVGFTETPCRACAGRGVAPAFDASPLVDWPSDEERVEHDTWSAIVALRAVRPDFLNDAAFAWLKERA